MVLRLVRFGVLLAAAGPAQGAGWTWSVMSTTDFNGPANASDQVSAVAVDLSGNVVVAGTQGDGVGNFNWRIHRYDASLSNLLSSTVNSSPSYYSTGPALLLSPSGSVYVGGVAYTPTGGCCVYQNWVVRKYDPTVTTLLASIDYNGPGSLDDAVNSLAWDTGGNLVAGGYEGRVWSTYSYYNWLVRKYDAGLAGVQASTPYDAGNWVYSTDVDWAVTVTGSGDIIGVGRENNGGSVYRWRIRKWNASLTALLGTTFYEGAGAEACAVGVDASGAIVVAGYETAGLGDTNWLVRRYDSSLTSLLGSTSYGGSAGGNDQARALALGPGGDVVVAGYEQGTSGGRNWMVRRYDATLSTLLAATAYDGPAGGMDEARALAVDGGRLVVAGYETGLSGGTNWRVRVFANYQLPDVSLAVSPSPAVPGQVLTLTCAVTNAGNAVLAAVTPTIYVGSGAGLVSAILGPDPAGPVVLGPGGSVAFTWSCTSLGAGTVAFTASISGFNTLVSTTVWAGATAAVAVAVPPDVLPPGTAGPLLTEPGAALDRNVFGAAAGERVLVRVLPKTGGPVTVNVFAASGRHVREIRIPGAEAGRQVQVTWDGRTDDGFTVVRGVYLVRTTGGGLDITLKVVVR